MKKYALLLLSGSLLTLASCGGNENNSTQAQIDSAAAARSAAMETELKAKNDSLINEMAKMRADSAMKAGGPTTTTTTTTTVPAQTHTTTKASNHTSSTKNTKATTNTKTTTPPNSTITKEQRQEQDNKFNER